MWWWSPRLRRRLQRIDHRNRLKSEETSFVGCVWWKSARRDLRCWPCMDEVGNLHDECSFCDRRAAGRNPEQPRG
jgi:hypothetical protein